MPEGYLGLDVGTQGLKGVVVDTEGHVVWSATEPYPTDSPHNGWTQQDPRDWERALDKTLEALASSGIGVRGVGLTGQMHTTVAADQSGAPLYPAILWSDVRAAQYGQELTERYGLPALLDRTGNMPLSNFSLLRLLWLRDHAPEAFRRIERVAVAKDWVRAQMTGAWGSDVTDASGTYLFDVRHRAWHASWITAVGLTPEWFGPVYESPDVVGEMVRGPRKLLGLPVVAGAGDQAASAVGTALGAGDLGISLGTSGVLFWTLDQFLLPPHPSLHVFCHAWPGTWHWMAVTQSAAASLRWFRDAFYPGAAFRDVDREAAAVAAGAEDVLFLPYLDGERAPIMEPNARGVFLGLTGRHTRAHLARAVLEGVAYSLRHCLDSMRSVPGVDPARVILTGGGAQSRLWVQILADTLGREILVVDDPGAAVGAAWLAAAGVGGAPRAYPLSTVRTVGPSSTREPYAQGYGNYRRAVDALQAGYWRSGVS